MYLSTSLGPLYNHLRCDIKIFFTVPSLWDDAAKAASRAATIQAGISSDNKDGRLTLIPEPEEAVIFCSKSRLLELSLHNVVLVADCGKGIVDLAAYQVDQECPVANVPSALSLCMTPSGDSCGSTALNRNSPNVTRSRIRLMYLLDGSVIAGKVYSESIKDFENRIKSGFTNNGQKWAVDVVVEADPPEAGIEEGYITFTYDEIL